MKPGGKQPAAAGPKAAAPKADGKQTASPVPTAKRASDAEDGEVPLHAKGDPSRPMTFEDVVEDEPVPSAIATAPVATGPVAAYGEEDKARLRAVLMALYEDYSPAEMGKVKDLLTSPLTETQILSQICKKYKISPEKLDEIRSKAGQLSMNAGTGGFPILSDDGLGRIVPDFRNPEPVARHFKGPHTLLARKVERLASRKSWKNRILVIFNNRVLIAAEQGTIYRSVRLSEITRISLLTHPDEGAGLIMLVKGQHDIVVRRKPAGQKDKLRMWQVLLVLHSKHPEIPIESRNYRGGSDIRQNLIRDVGIFKDEELKRRGVKKESLGNFLKNHGTEELEVDKIAQEDQGEPDEDADPAMFDPNALYDDEGDEDDSLEFLNAYFKRNPDKNAAALLGKWNGKEEILVRVLMKRERDAAASALSVSANEATPSRSVIPTDRSPQMESASKRKLERFLSKTSPNEVPKVDKILEVWKGRPSEMGEKIAHQFHVPVDAVVPVKPRPESSRMLTTDRDELRGAIAQVADRLAADPKALSAAPLLSEEVKDQISAHLEQLLNTEKVDMTKPQFVVVMKEVFGSKMNDDTLVKLFDIIDTSKSGTVSLEELYEGFGAIARMERTEPGLSDPVLQRELRKVSSASPMRRQPPPAAQGPSSPHALPEPERLREAWSEVTKNGLRQDHVCEIGSELWQWAKQSNGELTAQDFTEFLRDELGSNMPPAQMALVFNSFDSENRGVVDARDVISSIDAILRVELAQSGDQTGEILDKISQRVAAAKKHEKETGTALAAAKTRIGVRLQSDPSFATNLELTGLTDEEFQVLQTKLSKFDPSDSGRLSPCTFVLAVRKGLNCELSDEEIGAVFTALDADRRNYVAVSEVVGSFKALAALEVGEDETDALRAASLRIVNARAAEERIASSAALFREARERMAHGEAPSIDLQSHGLTPVELEALQKCFLSYSKRNTGQISQGSFVTLMSKDIGSELSREEIEDVFHALDVYDRKSVSFNAFVNAFKHIAAFESGTPEQIRSAKLLIKNGAEESSTLFHKAQERVVWAKADALECKLMEPEVELLKDQFRVYDSKVTGGMNCETFVAFMIDVMGTEMSTPELEEVFELMDANGRKTISLNTFVNCFVSLAKIELGSEGQIRAAKQELRRGGAGIVHHVSQSQRADGG